MKVPRIALIAGLTLLVAPAGASAQAASSSTAPPGSAAVDQYREAAPPAGANGKRLSAKQREGLKAQGKDGAALAAVIDRNGGLPGGDASRGDGGSSTGGSSEGTAASGKRGGSGAAQGGADPKVSEAKISSDRSAVTSTVGPVPIWALLAMAAVLVALALVVRRRPSA